jgi:hypothetical protein
MMGLDFMINANIFALINLIGTLVIVVLTARAIIKMNRQTKSNTPVTVPLETFYLMIIGVIFILFGSLAQPKVSINTPINKELLTYQNRVDEVVITTPSPRTETLEGFTPFKNK